MSARVQLDGHFYVLNRHNLLRAPQAVYTKEVQNIKALHSVTALP